MKGLNISLILTSDRQTTKLEWCSEKICTSQVKSVYTLYGSSIYENKKERKLVLIFIFLHVMHIGRETLKISSLYVRQCEKCALV